MAITVTELIDTQLAATTGDLFTATAGTFVTFLTLTNTDTSAVEVNLYLKESGGSDVRICPKDLRLDPGDTFYMSKFEIASGTKIRGDATTASKVDVKATGGVVS